MIIEVDIMASYFGGFIRFDTNGNMNLLKIFSTSSQLNEASFFQALHIS